AGVGEAAEADDRAARVDLLPCIDRAVPPDGVEVLEGEAIRIELAVAVLAALLLEVGLHDLLHRLRRFAGLRILKRDVHAGGGRRDGLAQHALLDEGSAAGRGGGDRVRGAREERPTREETRAILFRGGNLQPLPRRRRGYPVKRREYVVDDGRLGRENL